MSYASVQRYNMGLAVASGKEVTVYGSDRPKEHSREARNFDGLMRDYLSSESGKRFVQYVHSHGRDIMDVEFGSGDLGPNTVAATIHNGLEGIIVGNYSGRSFDERVDQLAKKYGAPAAAMREYVFSHELAHAAGHHKEADTERFIKDYFTTRAFETQSGERAQYVQLAKIAEQRAQEAEKAGK